MSKNVCEHCGQVIDSSSFLATETDVKEIIDYLNKVCGTSFRPSTPRTINLINIRFKEGFSVNDFKVVIDNKVEDWTGSDFEKYLRPETLFGNKFEGYLNENPDSYKR